MSIHTPTKIMRTLEDLAQQRLKLSSQHNSDLNRLLYEQQLVISDVAARSRLEIDSILNSQSDIGHVMLASHQMEMENIEMQIRQLRNNLARQEAQHILTHPFDF